MLILKRQTTRAHGGTEDEGKDGIRIELPDGMVLVVKVMQAGPGWAQIGIEAPKSVTIHRMDYFERLQHYQASQANSEARTEDIGSAALVHREE